jgi:hypothetical protein
MRMAATWHALRAHLYARTTASPLPGFVLMPTPLKRAARYRAHAAASLANAEAAADANARRTHLTIARHFYSLAEEAIGQQPLAAPQLVANTSR